MAQKRVLLVEDDSTLRNLIIYILEEKNYKVIECESGEEALEKIVDVQPDLLLLDILLPGMNGFQVCENIKKDKRLQECAIIILSSKSNEDDIAEALINFADDYVTKPFSPKILIARIEAVLRKRRSLIPKSGDMTIRLNNLVLDYDARKVFVNNKEVFLRKSHFEILYVFASNPNTVFSRDRILEIIRGESTPFSERVVDNSIYWLRRNLKHAACCIETVTGYGYRLKA